MFLKDMDVFNSLTRNMKWLSARQKVVSQNIANADTPGYRARDLQKLSFRDLVGTGTDKVKVDRTNDAHFRLGAEGQDGFLRAKGDGFDVTPNANSVVLEDEILKVNEARMAHDLATSLYRKHVQMLKTAITGRGR